MTAQQAEQFFSQRFIQDLQVPFDLMLVLFLDGPDGTFTQIGGFLDLSKPIPDGSQAGIDGEASCDESTRGPA
ncbi:MAG TPA: hypothetical protein VI337_05890 [Nitrospirales bacterium]|nr:hypothetical protein [Nitrospirales bacterium]